MSTPIIYEDPGELPPELHKKFEAYLSENCTSRCYNDIDCPHEAEFLQFANEEAAEAADALTRLTLERD